MGWASPPAEILLIHPSALRRCKCLLTFWIAKHAKVPNTPKLKLRKTIEEVKWHLEAQDLRKG